VSVSTLLEIQPSKRAEEEEARGEEAVSTLLEIQPAPRLEDLVFYLVSVSTLLEIQRLVWLVVVGF